jgi:hypothetical protein
MRSKLANWLRRLAEWLAPGYPEVQALMPMARTAVAMTDEQTVAGSIKWLLTMKHMERATGAKRRHINAAIDRAVLELRGD